MREKFFNGEDWRYTTVSMGAQCFIYALPLVFLKLFGIFDVWWFYLLPIPGIVIFAAGYVLVRQKMSREAKAKVSVNHE